MTSKYKGHYGRTLPKAKDLTGFWIAIGFGIACLITGAAIGVFIGYNLNLCH